MLVDGCCMFGYLTIWLEILFGFTNGSCDLEFCLVGFTGLGCLFNVLVVVAF